MTLFKRIPLFLRLAISLTCIFIIVIAAVAFITRNVMTESICLEANSEYYGTTHVTFNALTGRQITNYRNRNEILPSPDGKYTLIAKRKHNAPTLRLLSDGINVMTVPRLEEVHKSVDISWMPSGHKLLYTLGGPYSGFPNEKFWIADPDKRDLQLIATTPPLTFSPWSPDGTYGAFPLVSENNVSQQILRFWSVQDSRLLDVLQGIEIKSQKNYPLLMWAPTGHRLALIGVEPNISQTSLRLYIVSPDKGIERVFNLPIQYKVAPFDSAIIWSPDGRYIAFPYNFRNNTQQYVDVFDTKTGQVYSKVFGRKDYLYIYAQLYWSEVGHTLFFEEEQTLGFAVIAFDPQNDTKNIVALYSFDTEQPGQQKSISNGAMTHPRSYIIAVPTSLSDGTGITTVDIVNLNTLDRIQILKEANIYIRAVVWSPDHKALFVLWRHKNDNKSLIATVVRADGSLKVNLTTGNTGWRFMQWIADDRLAYLEPDATGYTLKVLDISTGKMSVLLHSIEGINESFDSLSISPDNKMFALVYNENSIKKIRLVSVNGTDHHLDHRFPEWLYLSWSPDNRFLVSNYELVVNTNFFSLNHANFGKDVSNMKWTKCDGG